MNNRYSHLVWLGAGNATEPPHLLGLADKATLYEAREAACQLLKKANPLANIAIKQALVTIDGATVHFTEYNLSEYSAVHPVTGLKSLFPGIKSFKSEQIESVSITAVIEELALEGNNNVLIVDIADCNLALLDALQQSKQLACFSEIMIQAGNEPLYAGAATVAEIEAYLQGHGYLLKQASNHDPDLPWLTFASNPLWQTLQQAQQANEQLASEVYQLKQELAAEKQQAAQVQSVAINQAGLAKQQIEQLKSQLAKSNGERDALQKGQQQKPHLEEISSALTAANSAKHDLESQLEKAKQQQEQMRSQHSVAQKQNEDLKGKYEKAISSVQQLQDELIEKGQQFADKAKEQAQLINELQSELEKVGKQAVARLEKMVELDKSNRILVEENTQLNNQQQALKQEMLKAEAQIGIIREFLLKQ